MSWPFRWLMDRFWWTCSMRSVPCVRSWRSLDHLPFDDGVCLLFGIPSQKWRVLCRVFAFRGSICFWLELVEFRLYLFSSCHVFDGIFMLGGVYFFCWYFICFLFQTVYWFIFMSYSLIYVFICVLFEIKKLICLLILFPHMRLCILFSVSRNI